MTYIGIDQSINSTGICINKDNNITYHLIVPHITKKQQAVNNAHNCVLIHSYEKGTLDINLREICAIIEDILVKTAPNAVSMEAISFGSNGRVIDLAQLVGYIRSVCDKYRIPYITIPPTAVKKFFVANGQADKELMIDAWSRLEPDTYNLVKDIKHDDLADAYAMMTYLKNTIENANN